LEGHLWEPERNWGYVQYQSIQEVTDRYVDFAERILELTGVGLAGAVYTQITDVEIEVNGLLTYDRKRIKVNQDQIRRINLEIRNSLNR